MAQNGAFWTRLHGHKTNYAQMPCTGLQDVVSVFLPIIWQKIIPRLDMVSFFRQDFFLTRLFRYAFADIPTDFR